MGSSINAPPPPKKIAHRYVKARRMTYRSLKSVHWCDLCTWVRNQKKNPNSDKLGIRPDHPRCRIEIRFCMVGGPWVVVFSFTFDQNLLSGYRNFRCQNMGYCITFANGLYIPVYRTTVIPNLVQIRPWEGGFLANRWNITNVFSYL